MKMTCLCLFLFIFLVTSCLIHAEEGVWEQKADMPTPRESLDACVINGRIYAIGGTATGVNKLSTVEEYDPVVDRWFRKADMLTRGASRRSLSASMVNGKMYAIGRGFVEEYDPTTNTWTDKSNMPSFRHSHRACVLDGKIYVIGGFLSQ